MDNPADFNEDRIEHCDVCNSKQMGTEIYQNDAMGMATPVYWDCHRCAHPPVLVGLYREATRLVRRGYVIVRYRLTTTREERERRAAKIADAKARMAARRAGA